MAHVLRNTICKEDGNIHCYWRCSVRISRRVIQQTVAHLGELDEQDRIDARALARQLIDSPNRRACSMTAAATWPCRSA
jgi:hypothetical protein